MSGKARWRRWRLPMGLASSMLLVVGLSVTATPAAAQGEAAIRANLAYNFVDTGGWNPGSWVHFVIPDPADPDAAPFFDGMVQADSDGRARVDDQTPLGGDLVPGMVVTVTADSVTKELVLATITLDLVDVVGDTLSGIGPTGAMVYLYLDGTGDEEGQPYQATAAASGGRWTFNSPVDITPETNIDIQVFDTDGDNNEISGRLPFVTANAQYESISTADWMPGTAVTLKVSESDDAGAAVLFQKTSTITREFTYWETQVAFDLMPGMLVTASGGLMTKKLVVLDVTVDIDPVTDTISGTTQPGSRVSSWRPEAFTTDAGPGGTWSYTFASDLKPSTRVQLEITDSDGDNTGFDAQLWRASLGAEVTGGQVDGQEFTPSAKVNVDVRGVTGKRLFRQRVTTDENGAFWLDTGLIHTAGVQVTALELANGWSKEVTLVPVTFDAVDASTGNLSGTAPPDAGLAVGVSNNTNEESPNAWAQADGNGAWTAELGPLGYDPADYQNMYGWAELSDEDGDRTVATYRFRWVSGNLTSNVVEGARFTGLSTVTVEIYRSAHGSRLYRGVASTDTTGAFSLAPKKVDLEPGMRIVVSDGSVTRDLVLASLAITGFDLMPLPTFAEGTAAPGTKVWAGWHIYDAAGGAGRTVLTTAGSDGHWYVDFGAEVPRPGPGSGATARTRDGDGDWTTVDYVPKKK